MTELVARRDLDRRVAAVLGVEPLRYYSTDPAAALTALEAILPDYRIERSKDRKFFGVFIEHIDQGGDTLPLAATRAIIAWATHRAAREKGKGESC